MYFWDVRKTLRYASYGTWQVSGLVRNEDKIEFTYASEGLLKEQCTLNVDFAGHRRQQRRGGRRACLLKCRRRSRNDQIQLFFQIQPSLTHSPCSLTAAHDIDDNDGERWYTFMSLKSTITSARALGQPVPPFTSHAISVSLPTWRDNVGYEEGEKRVVDAMACGYPRFFIHKNILTVSTPASVTRVIFIKLPSLWAFARRSSADQASAASSVHPSKLRSSVANS